MAGEGFWRTSSQASAQPSELDVPELSDDTLLASSGSATKVFPAVAVLANGDWLVAYRSGTSHDSGDGDIVTIRSTDRGDTWGAETTVLSDGSWDYRDPSLDVLLDGTVVLSVGRRTSGIVNTTTGAITLTSTDDAATWSAPVTISSSLTDYARGGAPVVELSNGDLLTTVYGENSGDAYTSTELVRSTDRAASWASELIVADGPASSIQFNEAGIVRLSDRLVMLIRRNISSSDGDWYKAESTDLTGTEWGAPVKILDAASGWPKPFRLQDGRVMAVYRAMAVAGLPGQVIVSFGDTETWDDVDTLPATGYRYAYSELAQDRDTLLLVHAYEDTGTDSTDGKVYLRTSTVPYVSPHTHVEADIVDLGSYPDTTGQAAGLVPQTDGADGWTFVADTSADETVFTPDYSVTDGTTLDVAVTFVWGIDADGDPYYNAAGVTAGDEAVLVLNNATGEFSLRPVEV